MALDAKNEPLTGDEIVVNTGTDPFRVRIKSPRIAPHLDGRDARGDGRARSRRRGAGHRWSCSGTSTRLATLYDAPFVQTIDIPATDGVGYLRAVATLKDDTMPPVEDVVMINTPAYMEELNVHLVELPTTVVVNGKPTNHLTEKAFKVTDEGKPVSLAKFEYVKNLPLSIGLAIDTSGSMQPRMDEAQKAGAQFFEKVMRRGDKAFLVAFDKEPQLVQKWSTKVARHARGPGEAARRGDDGAVRRGRLRALQLPGHPRTEGAGPHQRRQGHRVEVHVRSGARVRAPLGRADLHDRHRHQAATRSTCATSSPKLSQETGGSVYYIEQARDLQRIYDDIQDELRSQYILGFYPAPRREAGRQMARGDRAGDGRKGEDDQGVFPMTTC